jgi:2-phospho-L-lactate guanylyltransferase
MMREPVRQQPDSWVLIPVKAPVDGKSRLAGVLERRRRADLVERMLHIVVAAALGAKRIERVLVVSPLDPRLPPSVLTVRDQGRGLIPALDIARRAAIHAGARRLLVLPADLALLTAADIDGFTERACGFDVAIASDRAGLGTNALWLPAAVPFKLRFGVDSARRHRVEAQAQRLSFAGFSLPGLAFDVDTREDLFDLANVTRVRRGVLSQCVTGVAT